MFNQDGSTPIKNTSREGTYRAQGETGMRPTSDPKSQKDFKKILGRDSNDEEAPDEDAVNVSEDSPSNVSKTDQTSQTPTSVFGLSNPKAKHAKFSDALNSDSSSQHLGFNTTKSETASLQPESPSNLFARMTKEPAVKQPVQSTVPGVVIPEDVQTSLAGEAAIGDAKAPGKEIVGSLIDTPRTTTDTPVPVENKQTVPFNGDQSSTKNGQGEKKPMTEGLPGEVPHTAQQGKNVQMRPSANAEPVVATPFAPEEQKKDKFTTRFSTEQTDLSYVNPMALNTQPISPVEAKVDKAIMPIADIQEIVNQLVDKLYTIQQSGKTDTAIILKHPPILAGAQLIVTSFDNAKGEFNISFENLSQAAKNLLDMRLNQESLLSSLEQKGYAVHILTTTTLVENRPILTDNAQNQQQQRQGQEDRDQPRDGRQRRNQEEEERET